MKKFVTILSVLIILFCMGNDVFAQVDNKANNPKALMEHDFAVLFGDINKDQALMETLLLNSPKNINAPGLPRFAIIGKDRKFYLGIGGFAKGTLSYDFGNPIESTFLFTTSSIPMDQQAGNGHLVQFR